MVLVFKFLPDRKLTVLAVDIKKNVVVNEIVVSLPGQLSEKLWEVLPKLFNLKIKPLQAAVLIVVNESEPGYSAMRTVIAIMNVLGLGGVALFNLPPDESAAQLISSIKQELARPIKHRTYEMKASY